MSWLGSHDVITLNQESKSKCSLFVHLESLTGEDVNQFHGHAINYFQDFLKHFHMVNITL